MQGGSSSPFIRFCRYSYPKELNFKKAFTSGKAKLINEIDVYPEGIIITGNYNGTGKAFIVEGVETQITGKIIKKEEYENFIDNLERLTLDGDKIRGLLFKSAQDNKKTLDDEFIQIFDDYIEEKGIEALDTPSFFASFSDYLNGEFRKEAAFVKKLLQNKDYREMLKKGKPIWRI